MAQGQPELVGSVSRVQAIEIESLVTDAVRQHLQAGSSDDARQLVAEHVARVDVKANEITISVLEAGPLDDQEPSASDPAEQGPPDRGKEIILSVPWSKAAAKRHREIIEPSDASRTDTRPIRAETRARLVNSIARGRHWLSQIKSGAVSAIDDIAVRENCSKRHVNMTISLAFLAPPLVQAAVEGRLPHGIGVASLIDAPAEWSRQFTMLGLTPIQPADSLRVIR